MSSSKPPLILIAGPTASGKSSLAMALAQQINGVIVNADSAQIYKDLKILSAAPSEQQLNEVDHRLYSVADGATACSARDWAELARQAIAEVHCAQRTPILVGGTGLYIRTLFDGIAPIPAIDADVRERVRGSPLADNRVELEKLDPEAARRLRPNDRARISRALEVIKSTGRTLSQWQEQRTGGIADLVALTALILMPPRPWLYARCDRRFAAMIEDGALEEVRRLLDRKLDPGLPVMRAIGVRELSDHVLGRRALGSAIEAGQQSTRRYAKRQYTWFAHQPPAQWTRFDGALEPDTLPVLLALLRAKA